MSIRTRKILSLLICSRIVKNFCTMTKPETDAEISHGLDIPIRLVREIIFNLSEAGIISELCENDKMSAYVPALPSDKLTIAYVLGALDNKGSTELPFAKDADMEKIGGCIRAMCQAIENSGNNLKLSEI